MGRPLDKDASETEAPADNRPGRVEFDSRGNSVWRWAKDVLDSTTIMLKRLDNKDLALEPTQKVPVMRGEPDKARGQAAKPGAPSVGGRKAAPAADEGRSTKPAKPPHGRALDVEGTPRDKAGGFDPYNRR
jgi:hypothetical protein